MRIVFMGTPEFSLPSFRALLNSHQSPVAVVTQQDRPKGRGHRVVSPPVKQAAQNAGISVLQPRTLRDSGFLRQLRQLDPELIVVVAFGKILPPEILKIPSWGCVNVHASLLPKYRGAAPVAWAIIKGEEQTGVTTMRMDEGMDTGDIYLKEVAGIFPDDTAGSLLHRLSERGSLLLLKTIEGIAKGSLQAQPQDHTQATMAPMLKKELGEVDWKLPAFHIANLVRGLDPWPGAYTFYSRQLWKLWEVSARDIPESQKPGRITKVTQDAIEVATGQGILCIRKLQPANARRMTTREFLAGHAVKEGVILAA